MHTRRPRAAVLFLAVMLVLAGTASAFAVGGPSTTLTLDPPTPDGTNGWWRSAPLAYGTADADALLHYDWGTGEETVTAAAGEPAYLGFSPEGTWTLSAYAEDSLGATGTTVSRLLKTDTIAPTRPQNLLPQGGTGMPGFRWDACTDGTSGLSHYVVYRNLVGPPFSEGDRVGEIEGGTSFGETESLPAGFVYYGVRAFDEAGNASLMSDAIRLSTDLVAPTAPSDPEAWLNGRGFIRVSWEPAYDGGSGVAGYVVQRAFPGQGMSTMATLPAGALYWDDTDPEAVDAGDCSYAVHAFDAAGNVSPAAGPVQPGVDLTKPGTPMQPFVRGHRADEWAPTIPVAFTLFWPQVADEGSGFERYNVAYGPDPENPAWVRTTTTAQLTVTSSAEWAEWYFVLQAEDRAGNLSAWSTAGGQRISSLDEVSGAERVGTALAASRAAFANASDVVIASAWSFPDGLAASSLAGALRAPVLLVGPGAVREDVADELDRLGAQDAWVIGGAAAVGNDTFQSLDGLLSGEVTRVAGSDRYATAAAVAAATRSVRGSHPSRVIVVSGRNFPDALSAGPLAYVTGWPILFAAPSDLPAVTAAAVSSSQATGTLILGGPAAVWSGADVRLPSAERLSGETRYETSVLIAEWSVSRGLLSAARPVLVTGEAFPDGLAASAFAGERTAPVLLSPKWEFPEATYSFLGRHGADVRHITGLGQTMSRRDVYGSAWLAPQLR